MLFLVHLPYSINKAIRICVFYCPSYHHCIIWVKDMRQNISSGVSKSIFWGFIMKVECNYSVILLWDTTKKNEKILNYCIEERHTSTPYDIFRDRYIYPTMCLLLDTWHQTYNFITVCGIQIFNSNFEVAFPLTQDCLNYACRGNDTDEIKFVGVLHAIIAVTSEVVQGILSMK